MIRRPALRTARRVVAVFAVVLGSTLGAAAPAATASTSATDGSVTESKTIERTYLDGGKTTVVDQRKVTLSVDTTTNLRSLQLIHVSWSGAHPTGGIVSDQNSDLAQNEEYPFALFECRGTDTAAHPISPDTCWTQYADERFSSGSDDVPYPAWRADAAATPAQRAAFVDQPNGAVPSDCRVALFGTTFQRWVPFVGADKTSYPGGLFGCAGQPPEATPANLTSNLALPSNETFGVTGPDGKGSADFDVFTGEDHASLGCSTTVACSLVAVPVEGLSCDPEGANLPVGQRPDADGAAQAKDNCEQDGKFAPGQILPVQAEGEEAVDGTMWWSPSNWANRISVPLTFAPADNVCALNSAAAPVDIYGSELMIQASTQWAPAFCLNKKLFNLTHVQTPEPQARSLLSTFDIEAAYTSEPPDIPYPSPTVNAPVAVSGFGIAFDVDDDDQQPVSGLKLDARLLAKLLTESYPAQPFIQQSDHDLAGNPLNILHDPEFKALNPNIPAGANLAAGTLLTLNSDSDVMFALTQYIDADPEARAWLNGQADPWGMVVNPAYKNIALPVNNWPLLDTFEPLDEYQTQIPCLSAAPVPYLPLVAAPTARLFSIGQDMQFAISQTQTVCVLPDPTPGSTKGAKMVADGRQATGHRAMFGVVSLGDAAREGLSLASLETHTDSSAPTKFTDATGRTFTAPTTAALRAAAKTLIADQKTGTWPLSYDTLRSDSANAGAYPGTMVVYAAVPTRGLPPADAKDFGKLLTYAAGRGQQSGSEQGDLPAGYLPMTAANGLGQLAAYTDRAAAAVTAQLGALPSLTHADATAPAPPAGGRPAGSTPDTRPTTQPGAGGGGPAGGPTGVATAGASSPKSAASSPSAPSSLGDASLVAQKTPRVGSALSGWTLPILLLLAFAAGGLGLVVRLRGRGPRAL